MKLLFSEFDPDYSRYLYPYIVWGFPGAGETPADLYAAGFHPASPDLDRFVLCRHLRLPLPGFVPSSENRRILRKGAGMGVELVPRSSYPYGEEVRRKWLAFAEERFGPGVMPAERLDRLMGGRVISHVMVFREGAAGGDEVGAVLMHLEAPRMAHYYYAFYDRGHANGSLGLSMMTAAAGFLRDAGFGHLYLGTCYSRRALYKVQFAGIQFFDGTDWSGDIRILKHLVGRDARRAHLLEDPDFLALRGGWAAVAGSAGLDVVSRAGPKTPAGAFGVPG